MNISNSDFTIEFSNMKTSDRYIFISMFTIEYFEYAKRFEKSLVKFNLPHLIFKTPNVHSSISNKGKDNSIYTKSNLIKYAMEITSKSIIYIDCDCEIKDTPYLLINSFENIDFAVFNWLSGEGNQTYLPYTAPELKSTYFKPGHSIEYLSKDQLICSGAVQYWKNDIKSKALLDFWQESIISNLGIADDHCLDYAYNNFNKYHIEALWLPKSYARYAWWIFDQPVIDHPQIPSTSQQEKNIANRINATELIPTHSNELKGNILIDSDALKIYTFENENIIKTDNLLKPIFI